MTIQQGSVSLKRYRLIGDVPKVSLKKWSSWFASRKLGEVNLKSSENTSKEEIFGWVFPAGIHGAEDRHGDHFDLTELRVEDGFFLSMRIEKRTVPVTLLQLVYRKKLEEMLNTTDERRGLSAKDKRALKLKIKRNLLGRALPQIAHVEGYFRPEFSDLLVFSGGKRANKLFIDLFYATFAEPLELSIMPLSPPLLGLSTDQWQDLENNYFEKISRVVPTNIFGGNRSELVADRSIDKQAIPAAQ